MQNNMVTYLVQNNRAIHFWATLNESSMKEYQKSYPKQSPLITDDALLAFVSTAIG